MNWEECAGERRVEVSVLRGSVYNSESGYFWVVMHAGCLVSFGECSSVEVAKREVLGSIYELGFPELTLAQTRECLFNLLAEGNRCAMAEIGRCLQGIIDLCKQELPKAMREAGML
jgi:hypothetical protein